MKESNILIAKKTLKYLEKNSWKNISFEKIIGKKKINKIVSKKDLLININIYFDFILKKNLSSLEKSSKKDMLFEIVMARLDILNDNRKSIRNLLKISNFNFNELISILPSFIESMILILTMADIRVSGPKGVINIKVLMLLYIIIIFTWLNDTNPSLEKTMNTLDSYLSKIEKFFKFN